MHSEFTALMSLVLDKEATADEALRLREHVADCGLCAATWREWQALNTRLSAAAPVAPPANFVAGVMARLDDKRVREQRRRWVASGLLIAWSATFVVFWLVMGALTWWGFKHPLAVSMVVASGAQALSSLHWLVDGAEASLRALGGDSLAVGVGLFLCLAAGATLLWLLVMARTAEWKRVAEMAAGSERSG